mgnify:CR=1 FL=1|tara:strand:+ start:2051 stop:2194 length:144 start_codon:yes stop_codon:yes gene_type:complete
MTGVINKCPVRKKGKRRREQGFRGKGKAKRKKRAVRERRAIEIDLLR